MGKISLFALPLIVLFIIIYGFKKKINIYDAFLDGAKEGAITTFKILPNLFAMVFAVNILVRSGFINDAFDFLSTFLNRFNLTSDIIPMCFLRSISGNSTLVLMIEIFNKYGPDSIMGLLASTIQGSSDTTFYVIALYFGSIGITKSRYALPAGLFADFCGIIASFILVSIFFGS